jgi:NAD(P)-dependent dehydrogenase (short-subunit alcohol dehydrogenase family)
MADSAPVAKIDLAQWQRTIDVNLTGAFLTVKSALADVTRKHSGASGRIIFIASTAGLKGYPYVAAYCAAKHGVVGLTRALSIELAPTGVTVNAICPGYTDTPLLANAVAKISAKTGRSAEDSRSAFARDNDTGRLISPEEVAQKVLWLCLPGADAINGQAISISGAVP